MDIETIRQIALKLKGTTEDIKWEVHLCFNIGGKMYLVTNPDEVPCSASFKVDEEIFETVSLKEGFSKHSHLSRHFWVHLDDINKLSAKEWESYIKQSYRLVASKLSKKFQKEIGLLKE